MKKRPKIIRKWPNGKDFCSYSSLKRSSYLSSSGPIFALCSEHLSVVFRGIGFIRFQTRRNATTSAIAEANFDITRFICVRSRQRSTTYRLKTSQFYEESTVRDYRKEDLFTMFCFFALGTRDSGGAKELVTGHCFTNTDSIPNTYKS